MASLTDAQIAEELLGLPGWRHDAERDVLTKTYEFTDFADAMIFVNEVAQLAEERDHHPDIDIRWNTVTLVLSTHSAGGLTAKDFELASRISRILQPQ